MRGPVAGQAVVVVVRRLCVCACDVARAWDLASAVAPHRVPGDLQALPGVSRFPRRSPLEWEIVVGCALSPLAWEIERWKRLRGDTLRITRAWELQAVTRHKVPGEQRIERAG